MSLYFSRSFYTMLKPVSLSCGHSGCKSCIEMLFQAVGSGAAPKCALCRTTLTETPSSLGINVALDNLTRELPVQCMSSGCMWRGIYSDARSHHHVCGKLEVECGNHGCHHKCAREQMAQHADTCMKKEIPCSDCKKSVTRDLMDRHRSSLCFHAGVLCPLGCGTTLPRSHIILHMSSCKNKATKCHVPGCLKIIMRKDMHSHIEEAASSHFNLQSGEIQRLRRLLSDGGLSHSKPTPNEEKVFSFKWEVTNFMTLQPDNLQVPITSGTITLGRNNWRSLFTASKTLMLQLVSAADPQTVQIRIVMRPGEDKQHTFVLKHETLREGDMRGVTMPDMNKWMDARGDLIVKFIVIYVQF